MYCSTRKPRPKTDPRRILPAVLTVGATLCIACTGSGDDSRGSADSMDSADSGNSEWELVEDLRLDAVVEDFSLIGRLYVGPRREIVVPEQQDFRFRLYDSTGTLVSMIGRSGEGPGEFQHVGPVFWAADTLVVFDTRLVRTTWLLPDGALARTETGQFFQPDFGASEADSIFQFFIPQAINEAGEKFGVAYLYVSTGGSRESAGQVVVGVSRGGEPRVVATPPRWDDERWMVTVSGLGNPVPFVFGPRTEIAPDGSRFLFMTADQSTLDPAYSLTLVRPANDTVFARSYAYTGEAIPDSAMERGIADMVPENNLARRFRALGRERAPAVYGPANVTLGLDGTIWVELRATDRGTPAHVLSEAGDPIGSLLLPARSRIRQASLTHLWVTETDPLGLASVVRYRVIRPG